MLNQPVLPPHPPINYCTFASFVHCLNHSYQFGWNTVWAHNPPQVFPVDAVEGFLIVNETDIEACVPFDRLLNDVSQHEDLLYCTPTTSKTCLLFPQLFINFSRYSLDNITFPITFAAVGIRVIPLQLPQLVKSPFLGNLTISPLHQSSGILSSSVSSSWKLEVSAKILQYLCRDVKDICKNLQEPV